MGWWETDPDTRVGLLQEQARNMRSKCRCSCVLQFTCRLAASCVLHRPPSQLIHCMALCFSKFNVCPPMQSKRGENKVSRKLVICVCTLGWGGFTQLLRARQTGRARSLGPCAAAANREHIHSPNVPAKRCHNLKTNCETDKTCNDPSAGSPTETLLRLLLPLSASVWSSSRQAEQPVKAANSQQSEDLTKTLNR